MDDLANVVAAGAITSVTGRWHRHVSARYADAALDGRHGYGRWGTRAGFPILYLGQPLESVTVEAYRHLVDPSLDREDAVALAAHLAPRLLITADVDVTDILDLRDAGTRAQLGLTLDVLTSGTEDRAAYAACQGVAQVAHQIGRYGVIAPAATRLGYTLALFTDLLPVAQCPVRSAPDELWQGLPPDPRAERRPALRVLRNGDPITRQT